MDPRFSAGDLVGPWTLHRLLGIGGNAEVWLARRGDEEVALKILRRKGDRYLRFRSEVEAMTKLGKRQGVLSLLASHLPESPTKSDPAWLAMSVAIPLSDAIRGDTGIESAVRVTAEIAETLAGLHAEGVVHRDIKPSNLYVFDGAAAIGDFGLADYPEKAPLTASGDELGSQGFIAPEMMDRPDEVVDARPADVYSLCKVLFCLATRRDRPTLGQIRVDDMHGGLLRWVQHDDARSLARLIERGTANDPALRLTMSELASELRAWSKPLAPRGARLDFSRSRAKIGRTFDSARDARARAADRRQQLVNQVREVVLPLRAFQEALADGGFQASAFSEAETLPPQLQFSTAGSEAYACELRCRGPGIFLTLTLAAALTPDDQLITVGAHTLRPNDVGPGTVLWSEHLHERFLSVQQRRALMGLIANFEQHLQASGEAFIAEFKDDVPVVEPTEPIGRYKFRSVIRNPTPTQGEVLVAFDRIGPDGTTEPRNHLLRVGSYDPAILNDGDLAIEREARIQMALAGLR